MPVLIAALLSGLVQIAASMAGRVLIALGVGVVTYTGMSALQGLLTNNIFAAMGSVSPTLIGLFGVLKIGACINVLLSAYTIRLTLDGLSSGGTISRMVMK